MQSGSALCRALNSFLCESVVFVLDFDPLGNYGCFLDEDFDAEHIFEMQMGMSTYGL